MKWRSMQPYRVKGTAARSENLILVEPRTARRRPTVNYIRRKKRKRFSSEEKIRITERWSYCYFGSVKFEWELPPFFCYIITI